MKTIYSKYFKQIALIALVAPSLAHAQDAALPKSIETINDRGLYRAIDIANADPSNPYFTPATMLQGVQPLVISTEGLQEQELRTIDEDMRIMAHVLADTLGTAKKSTSWASGIPLLNYARETNTRDLFIKGTGALFFLNVDFPLAGPTPPKEPIKETPKDTAWERARRKVLGSQHPSNSNHTWFLQNMAQSNTKANRPLKTFQPTLVDKLLDNLAEALRSAANIRALGDEDRVWVIVSGPATQQTFSTHTLPHSLSQQRANLEGRLNPSNNAPEAPRTATIYRSYHARAGTRLTLSVSMKDIRDFDAGVLSHKDFRKRIRHHAK